MPGAAALLASAVLLAVAPGGAGLRIVGRDPLTLRGERFGALEAVRVEVRSGADEEIVRRVRADRSGTFTLTVPGVRVDGRTNLDVAAVGARGHVARFSLRHVDRGGERI